MAGRNNPLGKRIRDWYMENFPGDYLGAEINQKVTFGELLAALKIGENIYRVIGIGDSTIRERLLMGLAEILGVDYEPIYETWMA